MNRNDNDNSMMYLLAGFGLGALLGCAAGMLFAPKAGSEIREDLMGRAKELKGRTEEWIAEQKSKKSAITDRISEEVGA